MPLALDLIIEKDSFDEKCACFRCLKLNSVSDLCRAKVTYFICGSDMYSSVVLIKNIKLKCQ